MQTNTARLQCPVEPLTSRINLTFLAYASLVVLATSSVSSSDYTVSVTNNSTGSDFVVKRAHGLPTASIFTPATSMVPSCDGNSYYV